MHGKIVTGRLEGKLRTLFGFLFRRRTNAAVVVVNSPESPEDVIPFVTDLFPAIRERLSDT
jgi:hypothetical protein